MLSKEEILDIIVSHKDEIREYGVKNIGIFGSFARNTYQKNSDIDTLVEFRKGSKTFDNYMELKFYLERILGRDVDLVIKGVVKKELKPYILKEIEYARL